jgi:hypothetical protein
MYLGGQDGWVDDDIALARPWGFDLGSITAPVSIWYGSHDTRVPAHTPTGSWPTHQPRKGTNTRGGHEPASADYRRILAWVAAAPA